MGCTNESALVDQSILVKEGSLKLPNEEEIFYRELNQEFVGKEPSVLFVHGNTSGSIAWLDVMEGLMPLNMHLIAVDLRGFGKSSWNHSCSRLLNWAEDLRDFCKARGI